MSQIVDFRRARITASGTIHSPVRFVCQDGVAAAWLEDKSSHSATRILFATDVTYETIRRGRATHFTVSESEVWEVVQLPGGG